MTSYLVRDLISNFLKYMEFVKSSSPRTVRAYVKDLDQVYGPCKNDRVASKDLPRFLLAAAREAQMAWSGLTPASRNRKASCLKSFFNYLFDEEILQKNLALQIHAPKVPRKIPHFLSVDEALAVLKTFGPSEQEQNEKILFLLLYGLGLRVSEACEISWSKLDLSRRTLIVRGKGSKERIAILPRSLVPALKEKKRKTEGSYVWGDRPLNTRQAYEWIRSRGYRAQLLRPLHPHALRHSFATHLLTSGANLRTLQELLGHESLQATEKYTHLGVDQLARTLEKHHPLSNKK